jgi:diacylglycerol kinase (ATP)
LIPFALSYDLVFLPIPAGTGNDFARTMGTFGKRPDELLKLLERGAVNRIDVGSILHNGEATPYVQILSTGFDAVVNARANGFRRVKGTIKYVVAVLLEVWKFKPVDFQLQTDTETISKRAMLICVANGQSYGAGMKIVPQADNQDGLLDILIIDAVNPLRLLLVFPKVFIGKHVKHPKVHFYRARSIDISGNTQAFADGEFISHLPVKITCVAGALKVLRP